MKFSESRTRVGFPTISLYLTGGQPHLEQKARPQRGES